MDNRIELKPVKDLLGMNFFIPEYQRGYRWKTRQVMDLLEDIQDFIDKNVNGMYCLQPLVVMQRKPNVADIRNAIKNALEEEKDLLEIKSILQTQWDVVDGQQRLTTIFILLNYLFKQLGTKDEPYNISYATRLESKGFLFNINKKDAVKNIDFKHIYNTQEVISNWFKKRNNKEKEVFLQTILHQTEFIWYESIEDPIEVFTRLNIGKISLTNAELVKALLLNKCNFIDGKLAANEVAIVWDQMEYTLQNDRFWCFIHEEGFSQPTRIDFLLELVMILKNKTGDWFVEKKDIGNDGYRTFRYFYQLIYKENLEFKTDSQGNVKTPFHQVWEEIIHVFDLLKEWYNDNECYHYIGFLTTCQEREKSKDKSLITYLESWKGEKDKEFFVSSLKTEIEDCIKDVRDLNQQYEIEENGKAKSKTACFPLLLLFNVQTIVDKNNRFKQNEKFNALSFERFPFDLFKKEKGWDIEHIASNTDNTIQNIDEAILWLRLAIVGLSDDKKQDAETMIKKLEKIPQTDRIKQEPDEKFYLLCKKLDGSNLDSKSKNKIWNFCLLDQSTNRGYGNSIFATKRKWIINRERGINIEGEELSDDKKVFIPPCTLRVFTKFYSTDATDLSIWDIDDAESYKTALSKTLEKFDSNKTEKL